MILSEILSSEFAHEAKTTRRMLERLPADKLDWRPHVKSFTAIGLASHIVECLGWTEPILTQEGLDIDPATYRPYQATSVDGLLERFDERVAAGQRALATVSDAELEQPWSFKIMGRVRWAKAEGGRNSGLHPQPPDSPSRPVVGLLAPARRARAPVVRSDR